ncbi:MAG: hypothetical protein ACKVJU_23245 [Verrucomicrobiales bacterium]
MKHLIVVSLTVLFLLVFAVADEREATVSVDTSEAIWKITVKNYGTEPLKYDIVEGKPRGLGIEFWVGRKGHVLHAWNLADFVYVHPFNPDMRMIGKDEKRTFQLDPRSMSAEDDESLEIWKMQFEEFGVYKCRIVFNGYASPMIKHLAVQRRGGSEQAGPDQPATGPESKSKGNEKRKPESEGRSQ